MRIISLAPSNTEILYALGLEENIIAVTHLCKYPPQAQSKPQIGSWIKTDVERIRSYKPDLIFTSYFLPPDLAKGSYLGPGRVVHLHPRTLADVMESISEIGEVTGKVREAKELVSSLEAGIDEIAEKTTEYAYRPKVYSEEWFDPPMVGGNWVPELIKLAGGRELLISPGEMSRKVSEDEIFDYDPDIIILHWCGWGAKDAKSKFLKRAGWSNLRAVSENQIFTIDDSLLNCPGPRLVDGLKKINGLVADFVTSRV